MLKKYRLCLTVVLVFTLMGWFIEFLHAEKSGYQTSLFGSLNANLGFKAKNLRPSVIKFVPKDAVKIVVISTQAEPILIQKLEENNPIIGAVLLSTEKNLNTTLYIKSENHALFSHQVISATRNIFPQGSSIKISDFTAFEKTAKEATYFYDQQNQKTFIDYKTITQDADMILWLGKY